jgi:hypothetical protein
MSPFGDLAVGDCRSGGPALTADTPPDFQPCQRLVVYNVVTGAVSAVLTEPFKPPADQDPALRRGGGGRLPAPPAADGDGGDGGEPLAEWFATAPPLVPCLLPDGSVLAISGDRGAAWLLETPNAPAGRGGPFLGRLPPRAVNDRVLAHLTYRNAEQARAACKWLHDWTKVRPEPTTRESWRS